MAKWKHPSSSYIDPIRAELNDGTEILTLDEAARRFRARTMKRAERYVAERLAPKYPEKKEALLVAARKAVRWLQAPQHIDCQTRFLDEILSHWISIIGLAPDLRDNLATGVQQHVLSQVRVVSAEPKRSVKVRRKK